MRAIKYLFPFALCGAFALALNHAPSLFGATATVLVGDGAGGLVFVPAVTNIAVNDIVTWNWDGSFHSTTSGQNLTANGLWDSGIASTPHSFSQTFTNAGTFPYFCSVHGGFGMTGAVMVAGATLPPVVTITNPASGTTFIAPASIAITASASSSGGSITNVEFFDGSTVLGSAATSPYSISVSLAVGNHTLTAEAFDSLGATNTSSPVSITVVSNSVPTVTLTTPTNGATFIASASIAITASASSSGGSITNVEFFDGSTVLGFAASSPYSISVSLAVGNHTLTAEAFDSLGATNTSSPVNVTVVSNPVPTVTLTTPTNGATFIAPATVAITASASSSGGSITNVEFFDGSTVLGSAAASPYSISVGLAVGSHTLTAEAFDNLGGTNTSSPVSVTVVSSTIAAVTILTPADGSVFTTPAAIIIAASVTNSSSPITNVEFFDGSAVLGNVTNPPFSIFSTLGAGAHQLSAVATDSLGATNLSSAVGVTVKDATVPVSQPRFTSIVLSNKFPSPPLTITNAPVLTNGLVTFEWSGEAQSKFDLLYSADLADTNAWSLGQANIVGDPSGTNVLSDPPYLASPAYGPNTNLVYRLRAWPAQSPGLPLRLEVVATNLVSPTVLTHAQDGSGRLFIADQTGQIWIVDAAGQLLTTPFLDLSNKLVTLMPGYDERGLLGLAFHPGYSTNGRFFVYYVAPPPDTNFDSMTVLSEFKVSTNSPNLADPNSERVLLTINEPQFNHKGAALVFGPDGYLYLGPGDGGGAGDQHGTNGNAQILSTLLGKILRIDVDHGAPYAIPADNPFVNTPGALPEIYAYGLRNPWRFSFDRGGTHQGFIADVGQNLWEELDLMRKGANYGWRILEGNHPFELSTARALNVDVKTLDYPIYEYGHGPSGIAIIGGFVYRGTNYPALAGQYVFGDFTTGFGVPDGQLYYLSQTRPGIWERFSFQLWPDNARLGRFVKGFGEDEAGEIYLLSSTILGPSGHTGDVRKLVPP